MASVPDPPAPSGQARSAEDHSLRAPPRGMKAVLKRVRSPRTVTELDSLLREVRRRRPKADTKMIERAYELGESAHAGQIRKSGDAFITHPLGVATILAELGLDETTISAGLL